MNKSELYQAILLELENVHKVAIAAAQRAINTATDEESEAENKYDTFGLEASYLAHGQSKRVAECEADLAVFKKLKVNVQAPSGSVSIGSLVTIEDEKACQQLIFLSPVAGGLKVKYKDDLITIVTPSSPLGKAIYLSKPDEEIEVKAGDEKKHYIVTDIF